jgi:hypothetical protein
MSHRDILHADAFILTKIPEVSSSESAAQICDYGIGQAEAMYNVIEHINRLVGIGIDQWQVFDPLGKLVDHDENPFESTWSWLEGSDGVQSPAREGPCRRYRLQLVSRYMDLLSEELAVDTMSYQLLRVSDCCWPIETCSKTLPDQSARCCMVTAYPSMNLVEEFDPFTLSYTLLQDSLGRIFSHQPIVNQDVIFASTNDPFLLDSILEDKSFTKVLDNQDAPILDIGYE